MTERAALLDNTYALMVSAFFTSAVIAIVFAGLF